MVVQFRRRDTGETRWSLTRSRAVTGADGQPLAISIFHDLTDRIGAERRLRFLAEAGARLSMSLDEGETLTAITDLAVETLSDWAVVYVPDEGSTSLRRTVAADRDPERVAVVRQLQARYPPHPSPHSNLWRVLREGTPTLIRTMPDTMLENVAEDAEHLRLLHALQLASLLYVPLQARGRTPGVLGLFTTEASGRRLTSEDLALVEEIGRRAALAVDNARLYAQAREAIRARDEFLSLASHELRNPVAALSGAAQMLTRARRRGQLDAERIERYVGTIERTAAHLVGLTEDLLDVGLLQQGRLPLRLREVDLAGLVRGAAARQQTRGEFARFRFELVCEPCQIVADAHRLEQVLTNLFDNAAKYSPRGEPIDVELTAEDGGALLLVRDRGSGSGRGGSPDEAIRGRRPDGGRPTSAQALAASREQAPRAESAYNLIVLNYLDWELSPEQQMIQGVVREFVEREALPLIPDAFEAGQFPRQLVPRLGELGVLGPTIPTYGSGLDYTSYGLVCQELERGDSGLRSFVSVQGSLVMFPISSYGSEEQKARYLPGMHAGELIGCFGLTEHEHGSDPAGMETRAVRDGDDYVLNGGKMWITNGNLADVALIWAKVAEDGQDTVRGFLVDTDRPGFTANEIKHKLSLRASVTSELVLQDVRVPAACMLPGARGLRGPLSALNEARFGILFGAVGAAMACYEAAVEYAGVRQQFGRPIGGFQLTQNKLVDALQAITQAQLLAYQLGRLKDSGKLRPQQVSLGKRANVAMALKVARSMRSVLGANGISLEHPIFRHMVNLESVYTYEGTHEIHTLVVGSDITGLSAYGT